MRPLETKLHDLDKATNKIQPQDQFCSLFSYENKREEKQYARFFFSHSGPPPPPLRHNIKHYKLYSSEHKQINLTQFILT